MNLLYFGNTVLALTGALALAVLLERLKKALRRLVAQMNRKGGSKCLRNT